MFDKITEFFKNIQLVHIFELVVFTLVFFFMLNVLRKNNAKLIVKIKNAKQKKKNILWSIMKKCVSWAIKNNSYEKDIFCFNFSVFCYESMGRRIKTDTVEGS